MLVNDFYNIQSLAQTEDSIVAELHLQKDHAIFGGHFPGNPVVPGVCLLTMVKEVLQESLGNTLTLSEAKSIKFLGVINPKEQVILHLQCQVTPTETGSYKTTSTITAGEKVCYKASGVSYLVG